MNKLNDFIDSLQVWYASRQQSVYDATYAYNPWRKWLWIALIAVVGGLAIAGASLGQKNPTVNLAMSVDAATETQGRQEDQEYYKVVKVIDGDTIDVMIADKVERLRLIGMDTPETVDPRKVVQCFGKEASDRAKSMLEGVSVRVASDVTQGDRDKYDRLLRYVYLQDGTNFNKNMISEGYAHEYTYVVPYEHQVDFRAAENDARESERGLWSPSSCGGDTTGGAAPKVDTTVVPTKVGENNAKCDPNYTPCIPRVSYDLDCKDVGVRVRVTGTDVHRLDRDGDGYGCESQR